MFLASIRRLHMRRGRAIRGVVAIGLAMATTGIAAPLDTGVAQAALLPVECVVQSSGGVSAVMCAELQVTPVGGAEDAVLSCQVITVGEVASTGIGCRVVNAVTGASPVCACNLFLPGAFSAEAGDATGLPPSTYYVNACWYFTPIFNPGVTIGAGCANLVV